MQNRCLHSENGTLYYEAANGRAIITGYTGTASRIGLPSQIDGCPVTAVDRKAFLSQKNLYAVILPDQVEEIGDWAFAYCDNLTEISFPRREVRFGKAAFKNCGNLRRIETRETAADHPSAPELLAAAVTILEAYYLLDLPAAGSRDWLGRWDTKLLSVLRTADQEGYISQSVYGEEDYIGTDLEEHISARRKEKVRLAFLRLLHPRDLQAALKEELERYLRSLTKGQTGEETWQVLLQEHGNDRAYYQLFRDLGCIHEGNHDGIIADIGEDYPEMKAFFLKSEESPRSIDDYFQGLEL